MQGDVKFSGTRAEFVAGGLMSELDAEEDRRGPINSGEEQEVTVEESEAKATHKSVASLGGLITSEPTSETSSIAPEDEQALTSSDPDMKKARTPRKLIEDEQRARGRIAWPIWRAYFTVSIAMLLHETVLTMYASLCRL